MNSKSGILAFALLALLTGCATDDSFLFPAPGAKNVNIDTHLTLAFDEVPEAGASGKVRIFDITAGEMVDSLDLSIPAGPTVSRTYAPDIDYTKVPYDYSRTQVATNRNTVPGTPSGTAEPTLPDYQLNIIGGFTDAFHFHPIIINGTTATIYPHNNVLEPGHKYRVTIDEGVLELSSGTFKGITEKDGWTFRTAASLPSLEDTLVVDASGRGDFSTLQGALDFIPDFYEAGTVIRVLQGDYEEIVYVRNKSNVTILGSGMDETHVHYANNEVFNPHPMTVKTNERAGTFPERRAAVSFDNCKDLVIKDICFETDLKGQAEGLLVNGDRILLERVHIIGDGDALQANGSVYMKDCVLDGGADTILGRGCVFAYRCALRNSGGPFTWVRNFKPVHGDVFVECTFESVGESPADYGRSRYNHGAIYPDAEMVLIDCRIKNFIPLGWSELGEPTVNMLEFNTRDIDTGEPVDVSGRHPYSRQLSLPEDAALIEQFRTPSFVLAGWEPSTE